jgi:RNA polymerase-binding protein DksA
VDRKSKKTSAEKKPSAKPDNEKLTADDIEHFRKLLLEKRRETLGSVNEMEEEVLKKSRLDATGNLSSMPIHMADLGSDNFEQEFAIGLVDSERKLLREIDDALARIEEGTYGICQGSNKPIPKARLEAQPWARYSVEYAQMLEKGQASEEKE